MHGVWVKRTAIAAALAVSVLAGKADARAEVFTWKNLPADKDTVLYQSGDNDLRNRVVLCFWLRAEAGKFKVKSDRFREAIDIAQGDKDKPEQRVLCGSLITVRPEAADSVLEYSVTR